MEPLVLWSAGATAVWQGYWPLLWPVMHVILDQPPAQALILSGAQRDQMKYCLCLVFLDTVPGVHVPIARQCCSAVLQDQGGAHLSCQGAWQLFFCHVSL